MVKDTKIAPDIDRLKQQEKVELVVKYAKQFRRFQSVRDLNNIYVYDASTGVYISGGEECIKELAQQALGFEINNHTKSEAVGWFQDEHPVELSNFDNDPDVLCVKNGVLNLSTRSLSKHDPDRLLLRSIDASYNPDAKCPAIDRFLGQVASSRDRKLLQQFVGYILMGGYPYHKAFILVGTGDNGKTTLLRLLQRFIGIRNCAALTLQQICNERFFLPRLVGKMANVSAEMGKTAGGKVLNGTDTLLALTGESYYTIQMKGKDPFDFFNTAKMIFACNEIPYADNAVDAYYGRWIIIPFPNKFVRGVDMIADLIDRLTTEDELSGFLNYALDGHRMLQNDCGFDYPTDIAGTKTLYQAWSGSSIHKFAAIELVLDTSVSMTKRRLWEEYQQFCYRNGITPESETTFFTELPKALGGKIIAYQAGANQIHSFRGVRMKVESNEPTAPYRGVSIHPDSFIG